MPPQPSVDSNPNLPLPVSNSAEVSASSAAMVPTIPSTITDGNTATELPTVLVCNATVLHPVNDIKDIANIKGHGYVHIVLSAPCPEGYFISFNLARGDGRWPNQQVTFEENSCGCAKLSEQAKRDNIPYDQFPHGCFLSFDNYRHNQHGDVIGNGREHHHHKIMSTFKDGISGYLPSLHCTTEFFADFDKVDQCFCSQKERDEFYLANPTLAP